MCIDNCDIEVKLKYWDIKEDGNGALVNMYVTYLPTDNADTAELLDAILEEFNMRYSTLGYWDNNNVLHDNTWALSIFPSIIESPNCVYLILDFSF